MVIFGGACWLAAAAMVTGDPLPGLSSEEVDLEELPTISRAQLYWQFIGDELRPTPQGVQSALLTASLVTFTILLFYILKEKRGKKKLVNREAALVSLKEPEAEEGRKQTTTYEESEFETTYIASPQQPAAAQPAQEESSETEEENQREAQEEEGRFAEEERQGEQGTSQTPEKERELTPELEGEGEAEDAIETGEEGRVTPVAEEGGEGDLPAETADLVTEGEGDGEEGEEEAEEQQPVVEQGPQQLPEDEEAAAGIAEGADDTEALSFLKGTREIGRSLPPILEEEEEEEEEVVSPAPAVTEQPSAEAVQPAPEDGASEAEDVEPEEEGVPFVPEPESPAPVVTPAQPEPKEDAPEVEKKQPVKPPEPVSG
ncbi:hypothetical protein ACSSS7_000322 [Eimeria intestinalis]